MSAAPTPNVDHAELAKFDALAGDWWNAAGELRTLHALNPARLAFVQTHADLHGARVLDVGCGGGILAEALARAGAQVTGIDASAAAIDAARAHASAHGLQIDYRTALLENVLTEFGGEFDYLTCMELLEHVPDAAELITDCARVLKLHGKVFFSTLNRTPLAYFKAVLGAEYVLRLLPRGTHDYQKFIRPSELARAARRAGLQLLDLRGMTYRPLLHTAHLCDDVRVNYLVCCQRLAQSTPPSH